MYILTFDQYMFFKTHGAGTVTCEFAGMHAFNMIQFCTHSVMKHVFRISWTIRTRAVTTGLITGIRMVTTCDNPQTYALPED